jgi:hypothetical protein
LSIRRLLASLAAALVLATSSTAAPAEARLRPLDTGISGITKFDAVTLQHVRETGATFLRVPLGWRSIAPDDPPPGWQPRNPLDPNYDWSESDATIGAVVAAGLTPLVAVDGVPSWAERCKVARDEFTRSAVCDPDPQALADFAIAAASRYSGAYPGLPRVTYWQGLNEPNLSLFFYPQFDGAGHPVSPAIYRDLLNGFALAIKAVDRRNVVVSAGLAPLAGAHAVGPMRFTRDLLCMRGRKRPRPRRGNCGGGVHFDGFDVHPYTSGGPTHTGGPDDVELGDLGRLRKLLAAADRARRVRGSAHPPPLWVTEFSWDSKPPDPRGLPMKIEKRWVAEALYRAWAAGVSHFFWFGLRDGPHGMGQSYHETIESGLYFRGPTVAEDQPKPILNVFRFPFVASPRKRGLTFWGRTPDSQGGKVVVQVMRGGRWRTAMVAHADRSGIFEGITRRPYGNGGHGLARARYRGQSSAAFSMKPVPDFPQAPFG